MSKRRTLKEIAATVDELERKLDRIEVSLLVRDPGTSLSADAYNGLRKQVIAAASDRVAHLAQLAQLDATVRAADDDEASRLQPLVQEWMAQANLVAMSSPDQEDAFEIIGGSGTELAVLTPAYFDATTRRLIRQGRAKRTKSLGEAARGDAPELEPAEEMADDSAAKSAWDSTSMADRGEGPRIQEGDTR